MLNKFIKIILFLSSYSPLLFIFALQNPFDNQYVQCILILIGILSIIILKFVLKQTQSNEGHWEKITQINLRDGESMSYIATYLLPFLALDFETIENIIAIFLLFFMLAILYMNSNLIYTNPILNIFGYHIYEVQIDQGATIILLSKKKQIMMNERIYITQLDNNIYIEEISNEQS